MPIPNFDGETFVAFSDISGFKEMMKNRENAVKAIDRFYSAGYSILQRNPGVHGMFISDCAVLFVHSQDSHESKLKKLLLVLEQLNRSLLVDEIMLTSSVVYGQFSYHQRLEFPGIEKNPIYGNAYVAAFLDNETGQPRIQPGQCRILKHGLPTLDVLNFEKMEVSEKHWNYYWMLNDLSESHAFNALYKDAYQQKYRGMYDALKKATDNQLLGEDI